MYETWFDIVEQYVLALVWATQRLKHYMTEYPIQLICRLYLLRYLLERPVLSIKLARWLVILSEFDIQYVTQKSIKGSVLSDFLASLLVSDDREISDELPDEHVEAVTATMGWCLYFDGATNQLGCDIGILLISPQGLHVPQSVRLAFKESYLATNNNVEYEACISRLETTLELGVKEMEVLKDSNLVIRQIQGDWQTEDQKPRLYHAYLSTLVSKFGRSTYIHLLRAES